MYSVDISKHVTCRMAGRMQQRGGWEHNGRRAPDNIFVFVIAGSVSFGFDDRLYSAARGSVVVIPKGAFYTAHTDDMCEYYFFHFSGKVERCAHPCLYTQEIKDFSFEVQPLASEYLYFENGINVGEHYEAVFMNIVRCFDCNSMGSAYGRFMLDNEFMRLLIFLCGMLENAMSHKNHPVLAHRMISYIKRNISTPLTVSGVCAEHGVSKSYAARIFKRYTGMTMNEYINKEKLHCAAELILRSNMNLSEIAEYLSFCDVFYFSKLFKARFGITPSEFKKRGG